MDKYAFLLPEGSRLLSQIRKVYSGHMGMLSFAARAYRGTATLKSFASVAEIRTTVLVAAVVPWLMFGCVAFRGEELRQLGYIVKLAEPGSAATCDELAALFSNHAALRINPYRPPVLPPGEYCDITLIDTSGNNDDVSLIWYMQDIHIIVRHHGGFGLTNPNERTTQLAGELIKTTEARYVDAEVKPFKAYNNPFFGP